MTVASGHRTRSAPSRPRIAVVPIQGTLFRTGDGRLDLAWYGQTGTRLSAQAFLDAIPELDDIADLECVEFREGLPSYELVDADWVALAHLVDDLVARDDIGGVVVTHGTGNLEETAYFLDLALRTPKPVVVTGAMRPASGMSGDGQLNFLNAVRTAAAPQSIDLGVLVVLNDTILAARDATKSATFRVNTFVARDLGPLGFADADGRVVYYHRPAVAPAERLHLPVPPGGSPARVDVVISYINADGVPIDAYVAAGAEGIVCAGAGNGRATARQLEAVARAIAAGVVVCNASRTGEGRVVRTPSMRAMGSVASGNLRPWQARILLSLALRETRDPELIQAMFADG